MLQLTVEALNFSNQTNWGAIISTCLVGLIVTMGIAIWLSYKKTFYAITAGITGMGLITCILLVLTNATPAYSSTQVSSLIKWGAEKNLLSITEAQAERILGLQISEESYKNRYVSASDSTLKLTPVKDVYGNKVDVALVHVGETWELKQSRTSVVSVPTIEDKK